MGDQGVSSAILSVLVAGVLFIGSIGLVLTASQEQGEGLSSEAADGALVHQRAAGLSDILVRSAGFAEVGGEIVDWAPDPGVPASADYPDAITRLGLTQQGGLVLDFAKLDNLRTAGFDADPDDLTVNYEEARQALGLADDGFDFHIRGYPSLPGLEERAAGVRDQNLRVTYIGDYKRVGGAGPDPTDGLIIDAPSCSVSPSDPDVLRLAIDITNGGDTETQFLAVFEIDLPGGNDPRLEANSYLVPPATVATIFVDLPAMADRHCDDIDGVQVEVHDPAVKLDEPVFPGFGADEGAGDGSDDLSLTSSDSFWRTTDDIRVDYDLDKDEGFSYILKDEFGTDAVTVSGQTAPNKPKDRYITIAAGTVPAGDYELHFTHDGSTTTLARQILVLDAAASAPGAYTPDSASPPTLEAGAPVPFEVGHLEHLIEGFCPYIFDNTTVTPLPDAESYVDRCGWHPTGTGGDVFPDLRDELMDSLVDRIIYPDAHAQAGQPRLDLVQVLVVGSMVDHQPMVHIKSEVADWVAAGGYLIVLGSEDTNTQWLQSIFHIGIDNVANNGLYLPDSQHPLLHVTEELEYASYDNGNEAWKFTAQAADHFTTVVSVDSAPDADIILGISKAGAFGEGQVATTSWYAHDMKRDGSAGSQAEGLKLLNNLLMIGYRSLYLDYGPPIPDGVEVVPAVARAPVEHPDLGLVTMTVIVYVFPES